MQQVLRRVKREHGTHMKQYLSVAMTLPGRPIYTYSAVYTYKKRSLERIQVYKVHFACVQFLTAWNLPLLLLLFLHLRQSLGRQGCLTTPTVRKSRE